MVLQKDTQSKMTEHITNEEVFRSVGEAKNFLKTLKTRRTKLIGHIIHHNSFLSKIMKSAIEENNNRGRPPLEYIDQIIRDTVKVEIGQA